MNEIDCQGKIPVAVDEFVAVVRCLAAVEVAAFVAAAVEHFLGSPGRRGCSN